MRHYRHLLLALSLAVVMTTVFANIVSAEAGFLTTRPAQVRPLIPSAKIDPILTTGDTLSNGYTMAAIPDGMGAFDNGDGTFTLMMNHELTKPGGNLTDARVSKLVIDKKTLRVLDGSYPINGTEGYHRFCSATMVGPREGFKDHLFLTNEEATDSKFGGISVAVNPQTGTHTDLPWLGHLEHENTIALPGFDKIVIITTQDAAPGFIYMYIANNQDDLLAGKGQLYVFVADAGKKTPADISKTEQATGKFVPIDQSANTNAATLKAAATDKGAMVFTRLEDATYDVNSDGLFYFDTTGRSQFLNPATNKPYDAKGRLYAMQLDLANPTTATSLQVLLDGDAGDDILNPDNLATSNKSIMIQEDINDEFRGKRAGRVLQFDLKMHTLTPVAEIVQKDFDGNPIPNDELGDWETSGIINMADILDHHQWLMVTQAHTLKVPQFGGTDEGGQLMLLTVPGSANSN
jgi:secreted PhoX family phosphatase